MRAFVLVAMLLAAGAAAAQPARNANVYDGTAHQPTAGVQSQERAAGVAPPAAAAQDQTRELGQIGAQLQQKAARPEEQRPVPGSVYGVQPGGVVPVR